MQHGFKTDNTPMIEYLGHIGFLVMALAYLVKDLLLLRTIAIFGFSTLILFNYHIGSEPNWVAVMWNGFFIAINAAQVIRILYLKKNLILSEKEKELHDRLFSELSEFEFAKLIRVAKWIKVKETEQLIKKDQPMNNLYLIYNGTVDIKNHGQTITQLKDGHFIGEMSFFSRKPASADVVTASDCDLCVWEQNELRSLIHRSPSLFLVIQSHMGKQLSEAVQITNQASAAG